MPIPECPFFNKGICSSNLPSVTVKHDIDDHRVCVAPVPCEQNDKSPKPKVNQPTQ